MEQIDAFREHVFRTKEGLKLLSWVTPAEIRIDT